MRPGPCQCLQPHVTPLPPALPAGLRLFTNSYLLIVHQTPALCQELNTEQGTEEAGPRPQPACTHLPLGSHRGVLQPLRRGNLLRPGAFHPSPCLSLKQWFKAAIFPASVWFIWLPDSSKRWWSLHLFGGGGREQKPPTPSITVTPPQLRCTLCSAQTLMPSRGLPGKQ